MLNILVEEINDLIHSIQKFYRNVLSLNCFYQISNPNLLSTDAERLALIEI